MIAHSVAEIVKHHVRLTVEGIDRMYLNVYVPGLQYERGIVRFFREHRGQPLPSAALMSPMTRNFVAALEDFAARHEIALVRFEKGRRKDTVQRAFNALSVQIDAQTSTTRGAKLDTSTPSGAR